MWKSIEVLLLVVTAAGLFFGLNAVHSADGAEKSLEFVRLDLPDGTNWVLGEGGIGRPFLARLVLANNGRRPIQIWDPAGSEGSVCPLVVLADAQGRETIIRPKPVLRLAGVATARTLAAGDVVVIDLELLRLVDEESPPPPGDYTIRAIYANRLDQAFPITGVWTGTIQSNRQAMKIIAPSGRRKGR